MIYSLPHLSKKRDWHYYVKDEKRKAILMNIPHISQEKWAAGHFLYVADTKIHKGFAGCFPKQEFGHLKKEASNIMTVIQHQF